MSAVRLVGTTQVRTGDRYASKPFVRNDGGFRSPRVGDTGLQNHTVELVLHTPSLRPECKTNRLRPRRNLGFHGNWNLGTNVPVIRDIA